MTNRRHRFEHRHFDRLALSGALALQKRRHDRIDHRQPNGLVADQGRHEARLAAGGRFERDQSAAALNDVVKGRPVGERAILPVTMRRAVDQPRVDLAQPLPGEAEPCHRLRPHIVHQNIALPDQSREHRRRIRLFEVEHERALVAIEVEEDVAHLAMPGRLGIPHDVAGGRLDLDHLGAEVAEDLRRQRPQYDGRQIEDLDAGKRPRLGFAHRVTRNMIVPLNATSPGGLADFTCRSGGQTAFLKSTIKTGIEDFTLLHLQQICSKNRSSKLNQWQGPTAPHWGPARARKYATSSRRFYGQPSNVRRGLRMVRPSPN